MTLTDIAAEKWLGAKDSFSLDQLSGKVVAVHAFQMLCPGCVLHGIPQAQKFSNLFDEKFLTVLGLHTVFEHHEAMQEKSLQAFLHEFRVRFPVGIDTPQANNPLPVSMEKFKLRGTPSWLLFNKKGELVINLFGRVEDAAFSTMVTQVIYEDNLDKKILYGS